MWITRCREFSHIPTAQQQPFPTKRYADGLGETGCLALDHPEDTAGQVLEHVDTTDGGDENTPEGSDSSEGTSEDRRSDERRGVDEDVTEGAASRRSAEEGVADIGENLESESDEEAAPRSESQLRERRLKRDRRWARGPDAGDDVAQDSDGPAPGPGSRTRCEGEAGQSLTSFRIF